MARIRTIKPAFFTSEDVAEVSIPARLLFVGLWTEADKLGRLEYRPKQIKARLFPHDVIDVAPLLAELAAGGLIQIYDDAAGGQSFISIPTWERHQRVHPKEPDSACPAPPIFRKPGKNTARREMPGAIPSSPVGREGKGRDGDLGREGGGVPAAPAALAPQAGPIRHPSPLAWDRQHGRHVVGFCSWVCLPQSVFDEFVNRVIGAGASEPEAVAQVRAWAGGVRDAWAGKIPGDGIFDFWRHEWASTHGSNRPAPVSAGQMSHGDAVRGALGVISGR